MEIYFTLKLHIIQNLFLNTINTWFAVEGKCSESVILFQKCRQPLTVNASDLTMQGGQQSPIN